MDFRLIILLAVVVVMLIAFGNNPVQNTKVVTPQEAFDYSIQKKLKQQQQAADQSPFGTAPQGLPPLPGSYPTGSIVTPTPGMLQGTLPQPVAPTPPVPGPATDPRRPDLAAMQQSIVLPPDSFAGVAVSSGGRMPESAAAAFYLKDGRRIYFNGLAVLTLATDGQLAPLPDGRYQLKNGETLLIRDGKRQEAPRADDATRKK